MALARLRLAHWAAVLCLGLAVGLPFLAPTYYVQFATRTMTFGLLAMALNLVVGFGGLVSLCHAAFFGLAGYVLALASPQDGPSSLWLTLPLAVGVAAVMALLIGALALRTRGVYFIMVTLAFGEMLFFLFHDTDIGGGSDGAFIYFRPEARLGDITLFDLDKPTTFYFATLVCLLGAWGLLTRITQSPFGRALVATRDNERRARSLGFPVFRIRLAAFVVSGALAGLAGYVSAAQYGFVAPQMLGWHQSAILLVMVVLGGSGSVIGPLLGAAALLGLEEVLRSVTEHWKLVEGVVVMVLALAQPGGLRQLAATVLPRPGAKALQPVTPSIEPAASREAGGV